ncbi:hypothetical protein TKK_0001400 [Trichogramma kaykai]|uniref:28S ribosomal protein S22, mitochondrial n=1 Tax=Trichogramma kaykai TaxID=54128 RepID=A0ABD2X324_9HYME
MLSRNLSALVRFSVRKLTTQAAASNAAEYSIPTPESVYKTDPAPYFFNEEVQQLLLKVTRPDPSRVFRRQLDGRSLEAPEYKFMTDEDLAKAREEAHKKMIDLLQMPPIVKVRKDNVKILKRDEELVGYSTHKFVFTDTTFGVSNKKRIIVVREPNGDLRTANYEERDRLNQIYFPIAGREVYPPKMFQPEHLEPILDREDYDFILNRVCVQFDPDHPEFHRVSQLTYDRIYEKGHYEKLRSTRHYGPMVFYLTWCKKIDNLLIENIAQEFIEDAALTIKLYYILHPSDNVPKGVDNIKLIQHYLDNDCNSQCKRRLDNTLKMHLELESERKKVNEDLD